MPRMKLTNTTRTDCAPFSDVYIPANSHVFLSPEDFASRDEVVKNNPGVRHYFESGKVTIEEVPTEAEEAEAARVKAEEEAAAKAKAEADAKAAKK